LIACGAVGPLLFILAFSIEGVTRAGYSAWHNFVSDLSMGDQGWEQITNFVITGLLMLCFAVGLRMVSTRGRGAALGPILFGLFGLGLIIVGAFVTDPLYGPTTFHGMVHDVVTPIVFLCVIAACFVLAAQFASDPRWRGWAVYSIVSGVLVLVCLVGLNLVLAIDQQAPSPAAPIGVLQRGAILSGWGWIALFAVRILRTE
jgi:hypothetical membrane protein